VDCVVLCCSVVQCVEVKSTRATSAVRTMAKSGSVLHWIVLQYVAVCCSALQLKRTWAAFAVRNIARGTLGWGE